MSEGGGALFSHCVLFTVSVSNFLSLSLLAKPTRDPRSDLLTVLLSEALFSHCILFSVSVSNCLCLSLLATSCQPGIHVLTSLLWYCHRLCVHSECGNSNMDLRVGLSERYTLSVRVRCSVLSRPRCVPVRGGEQGKWQPGMGSEPSDINSTSEQVRSTWVTTVS
jgi:hypothetical protein